MINSRKSIKSYVINIIFAVVLLCLGLNCLINVPTSTKFNTLAEDTSISPQTEMLHSSYLSAPKLIEANQTTNILFVYDSYTKKLSSYNTLTEKLVCTSSWKANIISLCHSGTYLLALITEPDETNSLYVIDESTLEKTKLIYDERKEISSFTANESTVYMYLSSDEAIKSATINTTLSTLDSSSSETYTRTDFENDVVDLLMICNGERYYTTTINNTHYICKLNVDESNTEKVQIYETPSMYGSFVYHTPRGNNSCHILTSNNYILTITNDTVTVSPRLTPSAINTLLTSITVIGETKYFTDINTQTIWKYENSKMTAVFKNATPNPSIIGARDHKYIELTKESGIYSTPYATTPITSLETGTRLIVIANDDTSYSDFYYCMYTTKNENIYGYVPKNDSYITLEKTAVYIPLKVIGDSNNDVYYLPSGITDDNNQNFRQLSSRSVTTQILAQKITNSAGDDFYLIELDDGTAGYIRYSQVTTNFASAQSEKIKCNGKTKRDSLLLICPSSSETANYTDEEIETFNNTIYLKGNTRIFLNEKVKAGNTYTKVTYQTDTGETYIGYIKTADLDADGLTPLQTIGVILVAVNVAILLTILLIRKRVIANRDNQIQTAE